MHFRDEAPEDRAALREVHEAAFGGRAEADLVDALRAMPDPERPAFCPRYLAAYSRVAVDPSGKLVGHALLSPTWLEPAHAEPGPGVTSGPDSEPGRSVTSGSAPLSSSERIPALVLAPVGVLPGWQRRGIGTTLVRDLLRAATDAGQSLVFVLGDPAYYGRFGFRRVEGIDFPWREHADAFQVVELRPGALGGIRGTLTYPRPFLAL